MGSVSTQHREEFGQQLVCSNNCGLESKQRPGTQRADHTSPLNWLDDHSPLSADK